MTCQWQYMLEKFKSRDGILTTYDMISDIHTAAEYRRIICDLKNKGYVITTHKATPRQWVYRLVQVEDNGQLLAIA